ncbi:MAG TPA: hypothetical protein VD927_14305 [Chryseosolibacter sp.]|nr:hypothetical protein [Chryseosolibacter sp.]
MNTLIAWFVFLTAVSAFAERIDGPANIRSKVKGEIILSLNDDVKVEVGELENDWYKILISIVLTEEQYKNDIVKKGTKLYNGEKKEIGVALQDLNIDASYAGGGGAGIPKWYHGEVYGYTFKFNIKPESIVEPVLSKLVLSNKQLTLNVFQDHLKYFGYIDGLKLNDTAYKTYMIYESLLNDPSPLDRIRLIFEKERLIAIVHLKELNLPGFETIPIARERKLTLLKAFSPQEKDTFIEANKRAYYGVD